jgi:hypothetical protein
LHYNFDLDLQDGQWAEELCRGLLNGSRRVEVKRDFRAPSTGNVFVETRCRGRPSGISTTEAEYWAFTIGRRVLFIPTDELRALLPFGEKARGGDGGASDGVLLRLTRLVGQQIRSAVGV